MIATNLDHDFARVMAVSHDAVRRSRKAFGGRLLARERHPSEPAEVKQPKAQQQERESQSQTSALPGGARAAEPLNHQFVGTADDAPVQSPELDAAKKRECQTDRCGGIQSTKVIMTVVLGDRSSKIQYPHHALALKYRLQNRAISSSCGIDRFSNSIEPPT